MTDRITTNGRCLCGGVRLQASSTATNLGACHCETCRRWGGGPYLAVDCGSDVTIEGQEHLAVYDSSDWAERGFCRQCGTHLFYRLKHNQQHIISVGILDQQDAFEMDHQVFVDERPDYYCFANQTQDMTGPEVFAKYAPSAD